MELYLGLNAVLQQVVSMFGGQEGKVTWLVVGLTLPTVVFLAMLPVTLLVVRWFMHYGGLAYFTALILTAPFNTLEFKIAGVSGFNNIALSLFMVLTCLLPATALWAIAPTGFRLSGFRAIVGEAFKAFALIILANYMSIAIFYTIWRTLLIGISGIGAASLVVDIYLLLNLLPHSLSKLKHTPAPYLIEALLALYLTILLSFYILTPYWKQHVVDMASMAMVLALTSLLGHIPKPRLQGINKLHYA